MSAPLPQETSKGGARRSTNNAAKKQYINDQNAATPPQTSGHLPHNRVPHTPRYTSTTFHHQTNEKEGSLLQHITKDKN